MFLFSTYMGNQPSSDAGSMPASSCNAPTTLPDSFFTEKEDWTRKPPSYSEANNQIFDAEDSDTTRIKFRSSDLEEFSLSLRDVRAHTGSLVPEDWRVGVIVYLTEDSSILKILFQFIGPHQHPTLLNVTFDYLAAVAKAAEKYKIFSAMNTCSERMRSFSDRHPKLVLLYAAHHGYPHIIDECAKRVVTSESIEYFTLLLPDHLRAPWLRYHAKWCKALTKVVCYSFIPWDAWFWPKCWQDCGQLIFQALGEGVQSLHKFSWVFDNRVRGHTHNCGKCKELCKNWMAHAEKVIGSIGAFSEACK